MTQIDRMVTILRKLILSGINHQFSLFFRRYHEADIADAVSVLTQDERKEFFNKISRSDGADVLEEMDLDTQIELIQTFRSSTAVEIIEKMSQDDAVDLLEALLDEHQEKAAEILNGFSAEDQQTLKRLLQYKEYTAGGLMTPAFVSIPELLTVNQALAVYRDSCPKNDGSAFYVFVVNDYNQLRGLTTIRDLLLTDSNEAVKNIRNNYPIKVHVDTDQEDVAAIFQKYRSIVLPVVDDHDVILGVITVDDIVDVVIDEASEDMLKLSGTTVDDSEGKQLLSGQIAYTILHRLPWLMVSIFGGIIASLTMIGFSKHISSPFIPLELMLSFIPLLIGIGGNIGNQSATIVVRGLATHVISMTSANRVMIRETIIGTLIGGLIAIVVCMYTYAITQQWVVTLAIYVTIVLNMCLAAWLGALLPIMFKRFNIDPAIASAPFISTALDILGQIIYFMVIIQAFRFFLA